MGANRGAATDVFILGGWQSDFAAKAVDGDLYPLIEQATLGTLEDARVSAEEVDVIHVGNLAGELFNFQAHLGGMVAAVDPGLADKPAARHEAACASGSIAALAAMADLESGRYDTALVVGAEVMRNVPGQRAGELLGCAAWAGRELGHPFPWPNMFSQLADEYGERYGIEHSHLGRIAEINLGNAKANPRAQSRDWHFGHASFYEDDDQNPTVVGMLRKQDCGRITDGATGVVLASAEFAGAWAERTGARLETLPRIVGWGHRTTTLLLEDKLRSSAGEEYVLPHLRHAIIDGYRRAGISGPQELDGIETHDCFSISEYAALDHLGITPPGKSWQAVEDGTIEPGGALPINMSGGLLGLGHPVGATGVRMLLDSAKQVTGRAGDYQIEGARRVGTLNIGGSFTTVVSFVVAA